jgi:glycosyltransferase involved in cell wall biosynthesis
MKPCSILISSWCSHIALEMTIESILKRTVYDNYKIIVCDSSPKDSGERRYLRRHRDDGHIELLECDTGTLKHGEAINRLLGYCSTEFACLLDSDIEILAGNWLSILVNFIRDDKDLGAGDLKKGGCFLNSSIFRGPLYHPSCLLLNMTIYRHFGSDDDWLEKGISKPGQGIPMAEYKYKHKFNNWPKCEENHLVYNFDPKMAGVHYDTGGRFAERVLWENPGGLRMHPLPPNFIRSACGIEFAPKIYHFEGMSAHHHILDGDYMKGRTALLHERLRLLRAG